MKHTNDGGGGGEGVSAGVCKFIPHYTCKTTHTCTAMYQVQYICMQRNIYVFIKQFGREVNEVMSTTR